MFFLKGFSLFFMIFQKSKKKKHILYIKWKQSKICFIFKILQSNCLFGLMANPVARIKCFCKQWMFKCILANNECSNLNSLGAGEWSRWTWLFSAFVSMKPLDIFRETLERFPAVPGSWDVSTKAHIWCQNMTFPSTNQVFFWPNQSINTVWPVDKTENRT